MASLYYPPPRPRITQCDKITVKWVLAHGYTPSCERKD